MVIIRSMSALTATHIKRRSHFPLADTMALVFSQSGCSIASLSSLRIAKTLFEHALEL